MDLAAEFGIPARELRHRLTERELYDWTRYIRQRGGTPLQRIERLLARIALSFDVGFMGAKGVRLVDYLRPPDYREEPEVIARAMESSFAGGTVVRGPVQLKAVKNGK